VQRRTPSEARPTGSARGAGQFRKRLPGADAGTRVLHRGRACDSDANDPRITRAGDFLRGWQMDELPQLLSVMRDEMSLVGLSN
jgi:lipopolysaccharide/colanic/teichoic acid biosynthesis glycosyltransferase